MAKENLENLNKQLAEAQERVAKAEEQYTNTRNKLSDIGDTFYKSTMLTIQEQKYVTRKYKDLRKTLEKEEERRNVLNKALDEETKVEKRKLDKAKQEVSEIEKRIEQAKKPGFWARNGWTNDRDLLTSQYSSYQLSSGLSSIFEGRIFSGTLQALKVFPKVANFMGGPLYGAMAALAQATFKAVDAFYTLEASTKRLSRGQNVGDIKIRYERDLYSSAIMYNQKPEDYKKFAMSEIGTGMGQKIFNDKSFRNTYFSTRAALEQIGADPNKANTLIAQQLTLGKSGEDIRRFNHELKEITKTMNVLSSDKFLSAYEELNKTLIANNVNGMANAQSLAKFQDALNKGTLSANDFTRSLTTRRSSETSTLISVGMMLAEKGLGGKELQEAYKNEDVFQIGKIMRRGGNEITRGIEKLQLNFAEEMADAFGTSAIEELLAYQSNMPWGQLGADLKKVEVQNVLARGGSMAIGTATAPKPMTPADLKELNNAEKELINESVQLKSNFQAVGEAAKLAGLYLAGIYEGWRSPNTNNTTINNTTVNSNGSVKVVNPSQLNGD